MYRKNLIISRIHFTIVGILFLGIFIFSQMDGTASHEVSGSFSKFIARLVYFDFEGFSSSTQLEIISGFGGFMRKAAHFTLYFLVGAFTFWGFAFRSISVGKKVLFTLLIGFLYACSDEIHQYFIPLREGKFTDVILDTAGVVCGCIFALVIIILIRTLRSPRNIAGVFNLKRY